MYDYGASILPQYGLTALSTARGRGSLLCETETGWKIIRPYTGSAVKLELQSELQEQISASGILRTDRILRNTEGQLITESQDGTPYVLCDWYPGRECDVGKEDDILRSVRALARLHTISFLPVREEYTKESLLTECTRRNAEIRKIRKYIRTKNKKNEFEKLLLKSSELFLPCGEAAVEALKGSPYEKLRGEALEKGCVCHGEYTQHNILLEGRHGETVINFGKWTYDLQTADLYQFMRKILEKKNWDLRIGMRMVDVYESVRPLSDAERENVMLRLAYPWKYWKIANHYYGNNKVWISAKNTEKLQQLVNQRKNWLYFLKNAEL